MYPSGSGVPTYIDYLLLFTFIHFYSLKHSVETTRISRKIHHHLLLNQYSTRTVRGATKSMVYSSIHQ